MNHSTKSVFGLMLAICAISTAAIFIRIAQINLSSLIIATFRLLLSSLFLLPVFLLKNIPEIKQGIPVKTMMLIFFSGIFLAFHFLSWISSLEFTNITSSVVLVTTTPIWVSLISVLLLKETVNKKFWAGLLISFLGSLIISMTDQNGMFTVSDHTARWSDNNLNGVVRGNLLALLGAWCAAGYVVIGKSVRKTVSTGVYIFLVYTSAALILLLMVFISGQSLGAVSPNDWIWLILLALIPQLIGHSLINWALGVLPAAKVSISLLGEPVGASLLALIFLREVPTMGEVFGAALILCGIYLALMTEKIKPS